MKRPSVISLAPIDVNDTKLDIFHGDRLGDVEHHLLVRAEQYVDGLAFATLGTANASVMGNSY